MIDAFVYIGLKSRKRQIKKTSKKIKYIIKLSKKEVQNI